MTPSVPEALAATVRTARARLVGYLAARAGGELAAAEDALSDAVVAALRQWPATGAPRNPEAWLLAVARRRLFDGQRRQAVRTRQAEALAHALELAEAEVGTEAPFPDERLKLLLVCTHPAIEESARTPLMLQVVLGLEAEAIAAAFLVAPAAMAQRLVRAKRKIQAAGIPFALPEAAAWPERLELTLEAIYGAYTRGGDEIQSEAVRLAEWVHQLAPESAEAAGLLALLWHCEARRSTRLDDAGRYVPLDEQDPAHWDSALIDRAEDVLAQAARRAQPGRFQIEAAIQSVHAQRRVTARVDWRVVAHLYDLLLHHTAALGARLGHALAWARLGGPDVGLRLLDGLDPDRLAEHQPYWALRARLLLDAGLEAEARLAFDRAIALCPDPAVRDYLAAGRAAAAAPRSVGQSAAG